MADRSTTDPKRSDPGVDNGGKVTTMFPEFYAELRRLAHRQLATGLHRRPRTLNTTALIHESYVKLGQRSDLRIESRAHFFSLAARAMRQIIIDNARQYMADKRGGGARPVTFDTNIVAVDDEAEQLLGLDQAMSQLQSVNERLVHIVECRFFAGLTEEETAEALGTSVRTVQREWRRARGWLRSELSR